MEVESGAGSERRQPGSPLPLPPWAQSPPSSPSHQQQMALSQVQTSGQGQHQQQPQSSHQQHNGETGHQQAAPAGPKPAPAYRLLTSVIEKKDDGPGSRCGHTLTAVAAVGEEGSPSYIGPRLILFGGATALEGSSAQAGPQTPSGNAGIRLAGATADVHCYDVLSNRWTRLHPTGDPPSPRAAHAATAVGTMVVIQGGIGPAGLSAEDLHVLDLTQPKARWHRVVVQGQGPGPRYGHVMALVGQRFLLAVGGNDGKSPLADVWSLDTAAKPYEWKKLEPEGESPPPCMYATASARGDGLLLLCGGRDASSVVRRLESQGLTPKQAEAVTAAIIEVLNDSMDNVSQTFVSKPDMQKNEMTQEAALAKVTAEIQITQEYQVSLLQREVERIRTDVEKMQSDLRYEIDKVTAGQRLDINLERGRTRDDLAKQSAETSELTNKLDRETHSLKTQVEAAKYEVIKYGIGTIVSLTAIGLGLLRILM